MEHKLTNTYQDKTSKYLNIVSYIYNQKELYELEMKSLLQYIPSNNYFFSTYDIDINRSVFYRSTIEILFTGKTLLELENYINLAKLHYDGYKIHYIKTGEHIEYETRLKALRLVGFAIIGTYAMTNPLVNFALTKSNGRWIFGFYKRNDDSWKTRMKKPYNYSHALDVKLAKSIINIATGNDFNRSVIDPCCGIGTILIEGRALGIDIKGYELNTLISSHCNKNLEHFNFIGDVINEDMHEITTVFDIGILDIPYGLFSLTTPEQQYLLIKKLRDISRKAIIISMDDITTSIRSCGFRIESTCAIKKSNAFSRYLYVCI